MTMREITALERRMDAAESLLTRVPLRDLPQTSRPRIVQIIGGNLQNGVATIKYVSSTTGIVLPRAYDPTVDTVYVDGLGYGDLYTSGSLSSTRVLVRNDYDGFADSLMGGDCWPVQGFDVLTYGTTPMQVVKIRRG